MPSGTGDARALADRLIAEGRSAEHEGRLDHACARYRAAVEAAPEYAAAHLNLGIGLEALGDAEGAIRSYEKALHRQPHDPYALYNLGRMLYVRGSPERAQALLLRALDARPDFAEASVVLAGVRAALGDDAAAATHLESALRRRPDDAGIAYQYALVLNRLARSAEAETVLRQSMQLDPRNADAVHALGELLAAQGRLGEAEVLYRSLLVSDPRSVDGLCNLGTVLHLQNRMEPAAACYREAIALAPDAYEPRFNLGNVLKDEGNAREAAASYREALALSPEYGPARWALAMARIPLVAEDDAEVLGSRAAFADALRELDRWFAGERAGRGHLAVGAQQPFYLAYQEEDNRDLLRRHGELCARLMRSWLEAQALPPAAPSRAQPGPVRFGIVSRHFHDHPVWNAIVKGWFRGLDPRRFSLHAFDLGSRRDAENAFAASRAARFHRGPRGLRQWVEAILHEDLDVLVYPEIGMDSTTLKLASLRLAPTQAASWGHPETTGLPTIDRFLSAESLEPRDAQAYYTEQLVCFPHAGCFYEPRRTTPVPVDLARLGVEPGTPVLVCAGTPFKYAPRRDRALADIARRLGRCRLLFFTHYVPELSAKLRARLRAAFAREGLDLDRLAVFLPWQAPAGFHGVLSRADVMLDTIGFSGFNTAMQALECGLPIVARDGRFLRGRLASGALRRIGMDELVAEDDGQYVEIAVRLCRDEAYRRDVRERIAARRALLYEDAAVTAAMERFLESAARPR